MGRRLPSTPSDVQLTTQLTRAVTLTAPTCPKIALVVTEGPDADRQFLLADTIAERAYIGTSELCHVKLRDPAVSRRHAALLWHERGLRLTDLGSRNGTWVNGVRLTEVYLVGGESLRVGDTKLEIRRTGETAAVPAAAEGSFGRLVGASPEMRILYARLGPIAAADVPLLIEGETGTGKEVAAEAIHDASPRAAGPFVIADATTLSPALIEAELFGHERGAFTGAIASRAGLFEQAHGGTLFIDEIGDLDLSLQAKLLRAIERKQVRRVGSNRWIDVDVRIVTATRRNLEAEVQGRRFRDDLFYRLAVARVELPPLRRRRGDISFLARFFWLRAGGVERSLSSELLERFERYEWPGNVRELANAVARAVSVGEFEPLAAVSAPQSVGDFIEATILSGEPFPQARDRVLAEFQRRYCEHVLALHDGNVTQAAAAAGIGRRYFQMVRARRNSREQ